ncbi:MAG: PDZ domain-containing protein [bacterium]|nr:PDZ domain-containing protein [bacterium]
MNEINVIEEKFTRCPKCRSFSVKKTDVNFLEKIKDYFVPVTAQYCNNCSYHFSQYGEFSLSYKKNWLVVVAPLALIAIFTGIILLTTSSPPGPITTPTKNIEEKTVPKTEEKTQPETGESVEKTGEKLPVVEKPPETTETTETTTPEVKPVTPDTTEKTGPEETVVNQIIVGNSNRFGVNWSPVANGVRITRLSAGPLKKAGLQLGDVLAEVDGKRITTGNYLLTVRNEISRNKRTEAIVKVYRNDTVFNYKLVKFEQKKKPAPNGDEESDAEPANTTIVPVPVKVFSSGNIKQRKSAPDTVSPSHKWCFLKKDVKLRRTNGQRVYVAGDATGRKKWGVDDQLIINGKVFEGLSRPYKKNAGTLPENSKRDPLDITSLVPPDRDVSLHVELADHGIHWSNTDIYIVIK